MKPILLKLDILKIQCWYHWSLHMPAGTAMNISLLIPLHHQLLVNALGIPDCDLLFENSLVPKLNWYFIFAKTHAPGPDWYIKYSIANQHWLSRVTCIPILALETKLHLSHCNCLVLVSWVSSGLAVGGGHREPALNSAPSTGCPLLLSCGWSSSELNIWTPNLVTNSVGNRSHI
jgi:hypothetical protein